MNILVREIAIKKIIGESRQYYATPGLMKISLSHFGRLLISSLILCSAVSWLVSGCFLAINKKSELILTVQDTTGKPLPGVGVTVTGFKPTFTHLYQLETLNNVTNQTGVIKLTLSWPKGVRYYDIYVGSSGSAYIITNCPIPGNSPNFGGCEIRSDQNLSATIQVKKL